MNLLILAVYGVAFFALGIGLMIAIKAQLEYEADSPELGDIPEHIEVKSHRASGWRVW